MQAKRRYIVLGGTGFIGSVIAKELIRRGHETLVIGSGDCDLLNVISTRNSLKNYLRGSNLIYAAGIPRLKDDNFDTFDANLKMVKNLTKLALTEPPNQVIYLSSVEVYGNPIGSIPITEVTVCNPDRLYAVGKISCEYLWTWWSNCVGKSLKIVRLPGVFGPGDNAQGLVGMVANAIKKGQRVILTNGGRDLRDYVFVDSVANAIVDLSTLGVRLLIINIASGINRSIMEIVNIMIEELGKCQLSINHELTDSYDLIFDVSKFETLLPEFKFLQFREAIKKYNLN